MNDERLEAMLARWTEEVEMPPGEATAELGPSLAVLGRRRWSRRGLALVSALAIFGAGFTAGRVERRAPSGSDATTEPAPPVAERRDKAERMLDVASRPLRERIHSLREEGDRHLRDSGDIESALGCYRRMLALVPRDRRTIIDERDTWLLISLKTDMKERNAS